MAESGDLGKGWQWLRQQRRCAREGADTQNLGPPPLLLPLPTRPQFQEFLQEVAIMRKVRHRNVVQFIGACTQKPNLCIVFEFMSGGSVYDYIRRSGPLRIATVLKVRRHGEGALSDSLKCVGLAMKAAARRLSWLPQLLCQGFSAINAAVAQPGFPPVCPPTATHRLRWRSAAAWITCTSARSCTGT